MTRAGSFLSWLFGTSRDVFEDAGVTFTRAGNAFKANLQCPFVPVLVRLVRASLIFGSHLSQGVTLRVHTTRQQRALFTLKQTSRRLWRTLSAPVLTSRCVYDIVDHCVEWIVVWPPPPFLPRNACLGGRRGRCHRHSRVGGAAPRFRIGPSCRGCPVAL